MAESKPFEEYSHNTGPKVRAANPLRRTLTGAILVLALEGSVDSGKTGHAAAFPSRFESYLTTVARPDASERKALLAGLPVSKFLEADPNKEIAVFGSVWINAPIQRYVSAVKAIEDFESGGAFKVTKRISAPPRLEDFAELHLPKTDLAALKTCRVGKCELKLSRNGIERLRQGVDWSQPTVHATLNKAFRELTHEYAIQYLDKGNVGLAIYHDKQRPTLVEHEFRSLISRMPELAIYLPDLRTYLLEYPNATMDGSSEYLYWQEALFGLKATIRINHVTITEGTQETVVASKMLYSSHYFLAALELRILIADPARGPGFWLITINRSRTDGLDGFVGHLLRGRIRKEVQKGSIASLVGTKKRMESEAQ